MIRILFVCLGNICRSPTAQGVFEHLVSERGLAKAITCASAGIIGTHTGELPDPRTRQHAKLRGYDLRSQARQFHAPEDFSTFDLVLGMDDANLRDLRALDPREEYRSKIRKFTDFCVALRTSEVPDPYYGGPEGFELVLDIVEDASLGLLQHLQSQR